MPVHRRDTLKLLGASAASLPAACRASASGPPGAGSSVAAAPAAAPAAATGAQAQPTQASESDRMPVVFLPHGGGPWPLLDNGRFGQDTVRGYERLTRYLEALRMTPPREPSAVLVVSAHWEEQVPTVMSSQAPPMFYDYYGFPPETYEIEWGAPGEPEVAALVRDHLEAAGFTTDATSERGFDHGVYVPLMMTYPEADIPTFQLSLQEGLDPAAHLAMGRALQPLRDQGVFIVGSGMSYHNLRNLIRGNPQTRDDSLAFDEWMVEAVAEEESRRDQLLAEWLQAPRARACHPREEHLLPLMVTAGAAGDDRGTTPFRDVIMDAHVTAVHFG